ncbi:MAG: DUF2785 domain-containing protein [Asgard group archaeon]|nr:DUF2785 domain-containing protein [Asgard group archaeon]
MKHSELQSIIKNDYTVPEGADYRNLVSVLEDNLGDPDQDIRDPSFEILYAWCSKGILTDTEQIELGNRVVTNLSVGLGEMGTDSVFLRSFSALVLCGPIYADRLFSKGKLEGRNSFLTSDIFNKWLNQAVESFANEQDLRGYIDIKKWAHSIAHFGDLFNQFANNPLSKKEEHIKILNAIAKKVVQPANQIFSGYDDGRLCRIVATILMRDLLTLKDYEEWLQQFISPFTKAVWWDEKPDPNTFLVRLNARLNTRMFLRTLHFMLLFGVKQHTGFEDSYFKKISQYRDTLLDLVAQALKKLDNNDFYYKEKSD